MENTISSLFPGTESFQHTRATPDPGHRTATEIRPVRMKPNAHSSQYGDIMNCVEMMTGPKKPQLDSGARLRKS